MWCLNNIDFKVNYIEHCPTSGRDLKWTLQQQQQIEINKAKNKKQKKNRFVLVP